jgi:hypothetical protein
MVYQRWEKAKTRKEETNWQFVESTWSYHGFYRSLKINEKEHLVARLGIGVSDDMKLARMKT